MKSKLLGFAKAAIAIVVVIGLVWATRDAIEQWNTQQATARARISVLEESIAEATTERRRSELESELQRARSQVPDLFDLDGRWITIAAAFYLVGLVPGGLVLSEAVRVLGYRVNRREAIAAQIVGHLGKYVPGKAMVVVIRAGRLSGSGVPLLAGSIAVFLETLLMMAVGAAAAGCLVFFLPVDRRIAWLALIGGVAATLPTMPPILKWVVRKVGAGKMEGEPKTAPVLAGQETAAMGHDWRFFSLAWFWQSIAWCLIGASFACLVESIPGRSSEYPQAVVYAASVASIALAMVLGFASLLPGGALVRELTLAMVLAPVIGQSQALLAAILARLLFIAVELFGVLLVTLLPGAPRSDPVLGSSGNGNERNLA